jgi:hypothetical protein
MADAGSSAEDAGGEGTGSGMTADAGGNSSLQGDAGKDALSKLAQNFSAAMGATLQWSASLEDLSTTKTGCLKRRTTLLQLQFTPEGKIFGARSVFDVYEGGGDCPASCRINFTLQGARQKSSAK